MKKIHYCKKFYYISFDGNIMPRGWYEYSYFYHMVYSGVTNNIIFVIRRSLR